MENINGIKAIELAKMILEKAEKGEINEESEIWVDFPGDSVEYVTGVKIDEEKDIIFIF